jgi:hypothetical protein
MLVVARLGGVGTPNGWCAAAGLMLRTSFGDSTAAAVHSQPASKLVAPDD